MNDERPSEIGSILDSVKATRVLKGGRIELDFSWVTAGGANCEVCNDDGVVPYVTWHENDERWFVEHRHCLCSEGDRLRRCYPAPLAKGRWFRNTDTAELYWWRSQELQHGSSRREQLEIAINATGMSEDRAEGVRKLLTRDPWGDEWWKYPPNPEWANPMWSPSYGRS